MNPVNAPSISGNQALGSARAAKQDEFYTQLADIEKELRHYRAHFRGKAVLCNCDDPFESHFFRYFALNFNPLGLRKLVATSYQGSPIVGDMLPFEEFAGLTNDERRTTNDERRTTNDERRTTNDERRTTNDERRTTNDERRTTAYAVEINRVPDLNGDGAIDLLDVEHLLRHDANTTRPLRGDDRYGAGDFRSRDCVEILREADVVVTNPPFSLFRPYVAQLVEHDKRFLVVGNQNAITYKEVFRLIKEGRLWLGVDNGGTKWFRVPDDYDIQTQSRKKIEGGIQYFSMGSIMWFTNLDHSKRHESLPLYRRYSPEAYPTYDNYDAIEVSRVADIPEGYDGVMGVPITFLDKYNPEQFSILGCDYDVKDGSLSHLVRSGWYEKIDRAYLSGERMYSRLLIQKRTGDGTT